MISVPKARHSRPWGFGGAALNKRKSPLGQLLGEALAKPESGHEGTGPRGCGGQKPSLFWGVYIHALSCPNPKDPKNDHKQNEANERKIMKHQTTENGTISIFKRLPLLIILLSSISPIWFTACASVNRKDDSIHAILEKENVLLEKLQAERAQPEVAQAISENESLKKAEAHLALGLEELMSANKAIQSKILKQTKEEVLYGKDQRIHD